ncbi:MAG: 16S rRNA (guanine(527)-N(7))-methyltransferase RsmG [Saccharofermentanales bacterium]
MERLGAVVDERIIVKALELASIDASPEVVRQTTLFVDHLKKVNETVNLTAITDDESIGTRHLQDSWMLCPYIPKGSTLIDVGSGAGFPGLALKIVRSDLDVTLLDSVRKKTDFLESAFELLDIDHACAIHGRAEELGRDHLYRDQFDVAVARAVTALPTLLELSLPLVRPGGLFIAMKGRDDETAESKRALKELKARIEKVVRYELPDTDHARSLVIIKKLFPTPSRYPRRMATIKKNPL